MEKPKYIPGVCNIGEAEINKRKSFGVVLLVVTIVAWVLIDVSHAAALWKLFLIIPASLSATGFIQAYTHFCAGFGMQGVFNFGSQAGKTDTVAQAEFRAKDKKRAMAIFGYSLLIGVVVVLLALYF